MNQSHFSCIYWDFVTITLFLLDFRMLWRQVRAAKKSQGLPCSCRGMKNSKSLNFSLKSWVRACAIQHSQHNSFGISLSHCHTEHCQAKLWRYKKTCLDGVNHWHGVITLLAQGLHLPWKTIDMQSLNYSFHRQKRKKVNNNSSSLNHTNNSIYFREWKISM